MSVLVGNEVNITANGTYRIFGLKPFYSASCLWTKPDITPAGVLAFTVDGDPGTGLNIIDLSNTGQAGSRTKNSNFRFHFIDVTVTGLPENGSFTLYLA